MLIRKPHPIAAIIISTGIWLTSEAYASPLTPILMLVNSFLPELSTLAVIGIAVVLWSKQIHWMFIICICAAIWLAANADTVSTTLRSGI